MVVKLDCAAFKRDCGADPQAVAAQEHLMKHRSECADCDQFYQSMLALDVRLMQAFTVPVAQNSLDEQLSHVQHISDSVAGIHQDDAKVVSLQARKESINKINLKNRPKQRFAWFGAAAASVLMASFLFTLPTNNVAIAEDVIKHIHHEPNLLTLTEPVTSPGAIDMVLKQMGITQKSNEIKVLAAKLCPIKGQLSAHLVIQGKTSPVTLMIMPGNKTGTKSGNIDSHEFNGRFISSAAGNFAVVGNKQEDIDALKEQVNNSFQWHK